MSYYQEEDDQLGTDGDGLAVEFENEAMGQEYQQETVDVAEEDIDYDDEERKETTSHSASKHAEYMFSLSIVPSRLKDDPVRAFMDKQIVLIHADDPVDISSGRQILPKKVEVCNVTSNFFKPVVLKFGGVKVPAYNKENMQTLNDASLVVPGTPTPFTASKVTHRVLMEHEVHEDMKSFVKKFGEYSVDNIQTKGLERSSTMTYVPGLKGWTDPEGVFHKRHPVYTIAKPLGKYTEDPEGRLIIPNKEFDKFSAMTSGILQDHQQPLDLNRLSITALPLQFGTSESWTSLSNVSMPVSDARMLEKQYAVTGTLKVEYH